jgi:hypothetical protein
MFRRRMQWQMSFGMFEMVWAIPGSEAPVSEEGVEKINARLRKSTGARGNRGERSETPFL